MPSKVQERDMKEEINITNGMYFDFLVLKDLRPDHNLFESYPERQLEKNKTTSKAENQFWIVYEEGISNPITEIDLGKHAFLGK